MSKDRNCGKDKKALEELLLTPESASARARAHVESCQTCSEELTGLRATLALMDEWAAPDPSPYFDTRLRARLRSEQAAAPAGWLERVKAWVLFSSNMQMRPIAAGVLAIMLVAGGGTYAGIMHQKAVAPQSATLYDLQNLDGNAQVFKQLDDLDKTDQNDNDADHAPSNL